MARYYTLIGHRVQVYYWSGELLTPMTGVLAADSGKSIFLEERLHEQLGAMRWEISYRSIVSLTESRAS